MGNDEQAIRELNSTWIKAVNAGDLGKLLGLMTDDCLLLSPGEAPTGRDGFSARFSGAHKELRINCVSELEEVVVVGDVAYSVAKDSLSVTSHADGETARFAGHRITIWRKARDGRWLLARDAHTVSPVKKPES